MKYDFDLEERRFSKQFILKLLITLVEAVIVVFLAFTITRYGLGSEHSYFSLERVIGLPGERVQIKEGQVYINDKKLKEKLSYPLMDNGGLAEDVVTLDKNEYFVLGDNRNECEDSRNAAVGNISRKSIVGKAWIRMNSFTFVGMINNFRKEDTSSDLQ